MSRLLYIIIGVALFVVACKPQVPADVIQPDDMEDLLVDYHLARAMAFQDDIPGEERDFHQQLFIEEAFRKHGVSKADFDSSMIYYLSRAEVLDRMYRRVNERLDKKALALGASEGEIGRFASLSASGDTADIWKERRSLMLTPLPPANRWEFEVEVDTTFRQGDTFLLQFVSDFVFQSGTKSGAIVLSMAYEGDTIITRSTHFSSSGINQLRVDNSNDLSVKRIRGFFYLGDAESKSTLLRLLFLNNIQFIRFHHAKSIELPQKISTDSIVTADSAGRTDSASASHRDSKGPRDKLLPVDQRTP